MNEGLILGIYLTNTHRNVLHIGVTSNIEKRIAEHKQAFYKNSFSEKYNVVLLVHIEEHSSIQEAIQREKQLKRWNRSWKEALIEKSNPEWRDLAAGIWRSSDQVRG